MLALGRFRHVNADGGGVDAAPDPASARTPVTVARRAVEHSRIPDVAAGSGR
ncbi:hypothetical protein MicB006_6049 [Micromonospora sp. B006]|nr:hypothetical protein MicB006_6049 [Micromonospora sp. B006]